MGSHWLLPVVSLEVTGVPRSANFSLALASFKNLECSCLPPSSLSLSSALPAVSCWPSRFQVARGPELLNIMGCSGSPRAELPRPQPANPFQRIFFERIFILLGNDFIFFSSKNLERMLELEHRPYLICVLIMVNKLFIFVIPFLGCPILRFFG